MGGRALRDLSRRHRVVAAAVAVVLLVVVALSVYVLRAGKPTAGPTGGPTPGQTAKPTEVPKTPPPGSINVVAGGADPTGQKDSTLAIRSAIDAAQQKPGTVVFLPPGRYILNQNDGAKQDFEISRSPITVMGAGRDRTTIVEEIGAKVAGVTAGKVIFQIRTGAGGQPGGADGTTISGLTLDSASYDAGTTILDFANNTTISHDTIRGARSDKQYNRDTFGLRVIAICNHTNLATTHRTGNVIADMIISGQGSAGNTDLDLSCQINTSVSDVNDTGNGMDIYIVNNVRVNNYTYTPGTVQSTPKSYIITGPSDGITLSNITTYGSGGYLQQSPNGYSITRTTISRETMKDLSLTLVIGDADQTAIVDSTIGTLDLRPSHSTSGVTVTNSSVRAVTCSKPSAVSGLVGVHC